MKLNLLNSVEFRRINNFVIISNKYLFEMTE